MTPLSFMRVLMHYYTSKSQLNTLARTVEQLAGCLAQQAEVSSRGQSTTDRHRQREGLKCVMNKMT